MKIHIFGRHALTHNIAKAMRNEGHEVLYFEEPHVHPYLSMGWEYLEMEERDLPFVRRLDMINASPFGPEAGPILRLISDCDVILASGQTAYWAFLAGKPLVYYPFGGDISRWPFKWDTPEDRARAILMQAVLEHAAVTMNVLHTKRHKDVPEMLGLSRERIRSLLIPVDCDQYTAIHPERTRLVRSELGCAPDDFIAFLPSQLMLKPIPEINLSKGTDVFLEGYQEFAKRFGSKAKLWIIERGWQKEEAKALVRDIGLSDHVKWLPVCNKARLIELYNAADVVLDQIFPATGNHGALSVEAMACSKPVMGWVDPEHRKAIKEPPFPNVNVRTPDEVCKALTELGNDPAKRIQKGKEGRKYAEKYHSWPVFAKRLETILTDAIGIHEELTKHRPQPLF